MRGSVKKYEGKRGTSWYYVIDVGVGTDGRREQKKRRGFPTRKAAQEAMVQELHRRREGSFVEPSKLMVGEYLEHGIAETAANRKPHTTHSHRTVVATRITTVLGAVPLQGLTSVIVQRWLRQLRERGYAPSTVKLTFTILRSALAQAVAWGLITRNPTDGVEPPRPQKGELEVWSPAQLRVFLDATARDDRHALWRVLIDTGVRLGEAPALRWGDVDLGTGEVAIRRTLSKTEDGKWMLGEATKSHPGRREVALTPATTAVLRAYRAHQNERRLALGAAWRANDLVFDRGDGAFTDPDVVRDAFDRAIGRLGLPRITPHGLRHSDATMQILAGVPLKVVSDRLGHASIAITANTYPHVTREANRAAANRIAELLGESA